ncbi:MAG: class I SAM-dependent methyltransferase [Planctomycetota bacterium]
MPQRSFDSTITFSNSQGETGRGTLVSVARATVVFEVYNPYSVVQLSEVLSSLRILRGERPVYEGRAVVSNIVPTGVMAIVSATLVDPWQDLVGLTRGDELRDEVAQFVEDFDRTHAVLPDYQVVVGQMTAFLAELSRWLEQVEVLQLPAGERESKTELRTQELSQEIGQSLDDRLGTLMTRFEEAAAQVEPTAAVAHKNYARRQLHPYTLVSPFIHRTFTKPLGYAGDYEMVNMILAEPWEGRNTYAQVINAAILRSKGAQAHRNRVDYLNATLKSEVKRFVEQPRRMRVLNVGCGPAGELQRFVREEPLADQVEFHLLDFNEQTLAYTRGAVSKECELAGRRPSVEYIHRSVNDILREAARGALGESDGDAQTYDVVYCAGLFDYLNDKICNRLLRLFYTWCNPGGLVISTNVHPNNDVRFFLEHVLEWNLIYRDEKQMLKVAPKEGESRVMCDNTGVNVFLETRRPADGGNA